MYKAQVDNYLSFFIVFLNEISILFLVKSSLKKDVYKGRNRKGRYTISDYQYGYNGKEKDDEGMGGGGATYDYGFRIYNPQLGKFLSVDPLSRSYPWNSTYAYAENDVIRSIDLDGLEKLVLSGAAPPEQYKDAPGATEETNTEYYSTHVEGYKAQGERLEKQYGYTAQQAFTGNDVVEACAKESKAHGPIEYFAYFGHSRGKLGFFLSNDEGFYAGKQENSTKTGDSNVDKLFANKDVKFAKGAVCLIAGCNGATNEGTSIVGTKSGAFGATNIAEEFAYYGMTVIAAMDGHVEQKVEGVADGKLKISDEDKKGKFVKIVWDPIYGTGRNTGKIVDYKKTVTSLGREIDVDDYLKPKEATPAKPEE